ncbi:hypothetical protein KKI24_24200 [bacterium]|nr:hypothetical protein [bacterium]
MQLHNILIINNTIISPAADTANNISEFEPDGVGIISLLSQYLTSREIPRGTNINLVIDQQHIQYQYFCFPRISTRKIHQILQYELEDTLLKGSENYIYSYSTRSSKDADITETGVYLIEKILLEELVSLFKGFNLELRWISSLENLMDLAIQENADPGNTIQIVLSEIEKSARFLIYRNGFLVGVSIISDKRIETVTSQGFLNQINQKINAIRLNESDISDILVSGDRSDQVSMDDQLELIINKASPAEISQWDHDQNDIKTIPGLEHPRRVNLIKSNILIIQELKKYSRSLIVTAGIFIISLTLYLAATVYRGYNDDRYLETLGHQLDQEITKYLPTGTSKTNAIPILKERIRQINLEKRKNSKYERRSYQVSKTLTELSLLKKDIPSLTLSRLSLNDQTIRIQGNTTSVADFDLLQASIVQLYPPDTFRINTNEKNQGSGSIEFSMTIQLKPSGRP